MKSRGFTGSIPVMFSVRNYPMVTTATCVLVSLGLIFQAAILWKSAKRLTDVQALKRQVQNRVNAAHAVRRDP